MEALAVVSLAGNILQFVDFSRKLIHDINESYGSKEGSALNARSLEYTTQSLQDLCKSLAESRKKAQQQSVATLPAKDPLIELAQGCEAATVDLISTLEELKAKDPYSNWSNIKSAVRSHWKSRQLTDMQVRIEMYRSQLMTHLQVMQRCVLSRVSLDFLLINMC